MRKEFELVLQEKKRFKLFLIFSVFKLGNFFLIYTGVGGTAHLKAKRGESEKAEKKKYKRKKRFSKQSFKFNGAPLGKRDPQFKFTVFVIPMNGGLAMRQARDLL